MTGMDVRIVASGTVIRDDRTGQEAEVSLGNVVFQGRFVYMVQADYESLKAALPLPA